MDDIDQDMLDYFSQKWKVVSGDVNHRLSPGSRMYANRMASWVVGPEFRSEQSAREFLKNLRAAFELIVEGKRHG